MLNLKGKGLLALSAAAVLIISACGDNNDNGAGNTPVDENTGNEEAAPETDNETDEGSEEAAARVNGEEITVNELDEMLHQRLAMWGLDPEDEENEEMVHMLRDELLNQMITNEILVQEAERQEITVDTEEVDAQLEQIIAQFPSEEDYEAALQQQNYTEELLRSEIEAELRREELLTLDHLDESELEVSEEEVLEYYEQLQLQDETIGELEEEQEEIELHLKQLKYLEELREEADIEILV
ncbi:SurA N-terminal domain-containing protein [Evansella clarkii]|jgi:hypothetical protein|uniref:SurA N-terminal domain-containing protein n=1 Tax=Evansella clarkii TaxID=79879 RepID=UPI000998310F|nr:SurA N-terminal domain-containing protein [Evansella clarkii]